MAEETEFTVGARASCSDGLCGEVSRVIIDPGTRRLTHLVIGPKHRRGRGRLVPVDLVDSTSGEVRLRCTLAEFGNLDPAEETQLVEDAGSDGMGPGGAQTPIGIPTRRGRIPKTLSRWAKQRWGLVNTSTLSMVRSGRCRASASTRTATG
jgi:hypothetical protein